MIHCPSTADAKTGESRRASLMATICGGEDIEGGLLKVPQMLQIRQPGIVNILDAGKLDQRHGMESSKCDKITGLTTGFVILYRQITKCESCTLTCMRMAIPTDNSAIIQFIKCPAKAPWASPRSVPPNYTHKKFKCKAGTLCSAPT